MTTAAIQTKEFPVLRMTNGAGCSNLLAIINKAVSDVSIGDAILVPSVSGMKDPVAVVLEVDGKGNPLRNNDIAIVKEYIYKNQDQ